MNIKKEYVDLLTTNIKLNAKYQHSINYQPIGKKFWVKLPENGNIVRLRCEYVGLNKYGVFCHYYVGANGKTYVGNAFGLYNNMGGYDGIKIYDTYEDCFNGVLNYRYNDKYYGTIADEWDIITLIRKTYGSLECVKFEGRWEDKLTIKAFYNDNGTIRRKRVPFTIWVDKDGAHFNVVELDNGNMFATEKEALATYKPKVYDFDDAEDEVTIVKETTITITLTEEQRIRLTNMGII